MGLPQLVSTGFQVLFHSPPGVLFTFPSRYWFTIGHQVVFRLGGWSPLLPTGFLVSRSTPDPTELQSVSCTGLSPSMTGFPKTVPLPTVSSYVVLYPGDESPVWAYPFSLAATRGLDFSSSSSGYLDVSVCRVPSA